MESPHPDEPPAKKRRFFAEDSSPAQIRSKHRNSPPLSPPHAPASPVHVKDEERNSNDAAVLDGFDVGMLQAVVGELPYATLQKLKDVSSSNVERGDDYQMNECES
jgi:DNA repair protein RAD5